ncbi:MAG TPA: shikimate kinase [Chitinivibrionales bacterium]
MQTSSIDKNIVLIGMPGAGKSTIGLLLAQRLAKKFIDTDMLIQNRAHRTLQEILDQQGYAALRTIEEIEILSLSAANAVIATGGSAAYSEKAMVHLKVNGIIFYLHATMATLLSRIDNMNSRGIAKAPNQSFEDLYMEREALYRTYADFEIMCGNKSHETIVEEIMHTLQFFVPAQVLR